MLRKMLAVVAGLGLVLAMAGSANAGDEAKVKLDTVKGVVSVVKAEDGKVTVTIKAKEVVYSVAGEKAKELEAMDKKDVKVTGTITEKDGVKTIAIETVKEVPAKKEAKKDAPKGETK